MLSEEPFFIVKKKADKNELPPCFILKNSLNSLTNATHPLLQSLPFQVSKEELAKIVQGFDKTELLTSGGVTLAGQRYIYLSGTDRVIRAKLGKMGVHCMKTQQAYGGSVSVFLLYLCKISSV
ncbi:profilin isoform X2 [Aedes albopictus]|uniref:Profilin n=1 Tax=Aedes albopictus TaxID=7160 RepID=A0ABM1YUX7_AEDAL